MTEKKQDIKYFLLIGDLRENLYPSLCLTFKTLMWNPLMVKGLIFARKKCFGLKYQHACYIFIIDHGAARVQTQ